MRILILLSVFGLFLSVHASEPITAAVLVYGDVTNELSSHIKRELRGLHDCEVRTNYVSFVLSVVCSELKVKQTGKIELYLASVVVYRPGQAGIECQDVTWASNLSQLAERIVTSVDVDIFEPEREGRSQTNGVVHAELPAPDKPH